MFPETLINSQAKTKDHQFDGRCKTGCEYCSDDAFYVDDLLHRWLESTLSYVGDPTEEVLGDNEIELFVDKVMEISPEVDDRTRIHVNGITDTDGHQAKGDYTDSHQAKGDTGSHLTKADPDSHQTKTDTESHQSEAQSDSHHSKTYTESNQTKADSERKNMSSSRRSSRSKSDDGEFFLECKAAFLSIYDDTGDKIFSKKDLLTVLQQSGRNPSNKTLEKYWPKSTDELTFQDFVDICKKEPVTTADDLMKAFRKIDINGDGYISLDELYKIMNGKEETMTREEVRKMIDEVDENKDGRLDYGEFCNMIIKTTNECKKMSLKVMERKERKKKARSSGRPDISGTKHETSKEEPPKDSNDQQQQEPQQQEKTPRDAEQVEEAIEANDDDDIISPGRPTPKIDLRASPGDGSPDKDKSEHGKTEEIETNSSKTAKGKSHDTDADALHALKNGEGKASASNEKIEADHTLDVKKEEQESCDQVNLKNDTTTAVPGDTGEAINSKDDNEAVSEDTNTTVKSDSNLEPLPVTESDRNVVKSDPSSESVSEDANNTLQSDLKGESKLVTGDTNNDVKTDFKSEAKSVTEGANDDVKIESKDEPKSVTEDTNDDVKTESKDEPKEDTNYDVKTESKDEPKSVMEDTNNDLKTGSKDESKSVTEDANNEVKTESKDEPIVEETGNCANSDSKDESKSGTEVLAGAVKHDSKDESVTENMGNDLKQASNDEPKYLTEDTGNAMMSSSKDEPNTVTEDAATANKSDLKDEPNTAKHANENTEEYVDKNDKSKAPDAEKDVNNSDKKQNYDPVLSARLLDEIFKTTSTTNRRFKLDMFKYFMKDDTEELSGERYGSSEGKPPLPKERTHTHTTAAKLEKGRGIKHHHKEEKDTLTNECKQSDSGVPVPSPRKAISRVSEDEMPKPSPRIRPRDQKPKSSSRGKLLDARTLKDWSMQTSKGCFFYEDGEIVTHIYSLKLTEESAVYFSAYPIQEPASLALPSGEPVDTVLYILDSRGKLVTFTEQKDSKGRYGVKCDLTPGEYQIVPYTTGCRFRQRTPNDHVRDAKLVKKDKDDKIVITSAFRKALEDIFDLCDLDDNGTMSKDEFNWFNLRTSGEELGDDEWEVVEEKTTLENGEITKRGFIELNEMEAEDSEGDVEDLWITLSSMGLNKALIMDEASPFRVEVYVEKTGRREPKFKCMGIESLEKRELVQEICQSVIEKSQSEPVKIRNMKDLYMHTYKNDHRATVALENRSRSKVNVEIDCSRSKNAVSHRDSLDHTVEVEPQSMAIAHHLMPAREGVDWTVICTESIHK